MPVATPRTGSTMRPVSTRRPPSSPRAVQRVTWPATCASIAAAPTNGLFKPSERMPGPRPTQPGAEPNHNPEVVGKPRHEEQDAVTVEGVAILAVKFIR